VPPGSKEVSPLLNRVNDAGGLCQLGQKPKTQGHSVGAAKPEKVFTKRKPGASFSKLFTGLLGFSWPKPRPQYLTNAPDFAIL
jgi:hypothetical protein